MLKKIYLQLLTALLLVGLHTDMQAAALQVTSFNDYSVAPVSMRKMFVSIKSNGVEAPVSLGNFGNDAVKSIEYTLTFGDKVIETKTLSFTEVILPRDSKLINVHIPPHTTISVTELIFEVTKVNGQPNYATVPRTTITRTTLTQVPKRKVVVEDYTAMWCRYCPTGIAMVENLANNFPEDFIGIAVHAGRDALYCPSYQSKLNEIRGYPTVMFNRTTRFGYFNGTNQFKSERAKGAEMDINVSAVWDKEKNNISVTSQTIFRLNKEKAPYALAYVLTADGLENGSWYQYNSYSGSTADLGVTKEMDYFIHAPYYIRDMKFNHTAIAAMGIKDGLAESIKAPITADEAQIHHASFDNISQYSAIQDKAKLHVCVLLINTDTKEIVNADQCTISDGTTTDIDNTLATGKSIETARYNAAGQRISHPTRGLNIVKYSDGRTVKEIVR